MSCLATDAMSHTFLFHISKTIPRSKPNAKLLSTIQTGSSALPVRSFSSSSSTASSPPLVTLWGGEALLQSLRKSSSKTLFVALQPLKQPSNVRSLSTSSVQLRERDPKDEGSGSEEGGSTAGQGGDHGSGDDGGGGEGKPSALFHVIDNQLQKPSVPENYPQVLALPIARRPLFPGFYKAVVVKDSDVTGAIKELLRRGQPYVGAFLLKDEENDVDKIKSLDQVYPVGVFAQITSVFPAGGGMMREKDGEQQQQEPGLTAVLYPHRRIKITDLIPPRGHDRKEVDPRITIARAEIEHKTSKSYLLL